jgi:Na+/melibiose symporter-like transporter
MIYFLLFQFGGLIKNGSMGYYCYAMFNAESIGEAGAYQGLLGLIGGIPIAVGMVIAWPIASKMGKRNSMILGFGLSVIGGLASFIDTTNFVIVCVGVVLKGVGSIPGMYVSLALLSDVLDHLEAKNGYRSDGLTMSIYSSIMVGLSGLGTGIVNLLLSRSGYNFSDLLFQTQSAKIAVVWCYLGIELICYGVLVIILLFTNVEKNIVNDQKIILEKKLDRR